MNKSLDSFQQASQDDLLQQRSTRNTGMHMQKKAPVVLGYSLSATNQVEKKTTPDVSVAAALQQPFTFSFVERFISDFFKFIIIPKTIPWFILAKDEASFVICVTLSTDIRYLTAVISLSCTRTPHDSPDTQWRHLELEIAKYRCSTLMKISFLHFQQ